MYMVIDRDCNYEDNKMIGFPAKLLSTGILSTIYVWVGWCMYIYVRMELDELSNERIIMNLDEKLMEIV